MFQWALRERKRTLKTCTTLTCVQQKGEQYSPDNGEEEMGSERTEIKMQFETCHNGPGQMAVVSTAFGECLHNHDQNILHIM